MVEARKQTGYGPRRLALYLRRKGIALSPHTIRHILDRHHLTRPRPQRRRPLYPAHWAWEENRPLLFWQVDFKDVLDKKSLGTLLYTHFHRHHFPRYQLTCCDVRTRLRFLLFAHHLNRTNAFAGLLIILLWLRAHQVEGEIVLQTDWGQEFGVTTPSRLPIWRSISWLL